MKTNTSGRHKPNVKRKCIVCGKVTESIYCSRECVIKMQIIEFDAPIQQLAREARQARDGKP